MLTVIININYLKKREINTAGCQVQIQKMLNVYLNQNLIRQTCHLTSYISEFCFSEAVIRIISRAIRNCCIGYWHLPLGAKT